MRSKASCFSLPGISKKVIFNQNHMYTRHLMNKILIFKKSLSFHIFSSIFTCFSSAQHLSDTFWRFSYIILHLLHVLYVVGKRCKRVGFHSCSDRGVRRANTRYRSTTDVRAIPQCTFRRVNGIMEHDRHTHNTAEDHRASTQYRGVPAPNGALNTKPGRDSVRRSPTRTSSINISGVNKAIL